MRVPVIALGSAMAVGVAITAGTLLYFAGYRDGMKATRNAQVETWAFVVHPTREQAFDARSGELIEGQIMYLGQRELPEWHCGTHIAGEEDTILFVRSCTSEET